MLWKNSRISRKRPWWSLRKRGPDTSIFLKRMYFFTLWKRSYDMFTVVPCCHSNVFVCTDRRTKREDTMRWRLKTMENYKTVDRKTLSRSLKRGCRLQHVLITGLWVVLVRTRMFDFLFFSCQSLISLSDNSWRRNKFLRLLLYFRGF